MKKDIENRADIEVLIKGFYDKVKQDLVIGYLFNDVAKVKWAKHLPVMYDFWEGIVFNKNTYTGNPIPVHQKLNTLSPLKQEHFKQWLHLFTTTVDELFEGPKAELAKQRAVGIATVMQIKIFNHSVLNVTGTDG